MNDMVKFQWVMEFPDGRPATTAAEAMSLPELLYWVLFGEGRLETVEDQLRS